MNQSPPANRGDLELPPALLALAICLGFAALWTVAAGLSHRSPDLDNVEELVWASSWEWGYAKHPPLGTWLLYPVTMAIGKPVWLTFAMGQLCVAAALLIVWRLFTDIANRAEPGLPSQMARMAPLVALLAAWPIAYFTALGTVYNVNTVQLLPTAGMIWFYHRAWAKSGNARWVAWIGLGVCVALSLLSKFSGVIQCAALAVHFLWAGRWRNLLDWLGVALSIAVASLILAPHVLWLLQQTQQAQGPIAYARRSLASSLSYPKHLAAIGAFLLTQLARLVPYLLVVWGIAVWRKRQSRNDAIKRQPSQINQNGRSVWSQIRPDDRVFLIIAGAGPLTLTVVIATILQTRLTGSWAATFFVLFGAFAWTQLAGHFPWKRMLVAVTALQIAMAIAYGVARGPLADHLGRESRSTFPGPHLSERLQSRWEENSQTTGGLPLTVVAGDMWTAGNVAIHGPDKGRRIQVWIDADRNLAPWIEDKHLEQPILVIANTSTNRADPVAPAVAAMLERAVVRGREDLPWTTQPGGPRVTVEWGIVTP